MLLLLCCLIECWKLQLEDLKQKPRRGNKSNKCSQVITYDGGMVIMRKGLKDIKTYLHHWSSKQVRWD